MVCGADGVTYRSLCELRQKSCKTGRTISMSHRGPCLGIGELKLETINKLIKMKTQNGDKDN